MLPLGKGCCCWVFFFFNGLKVDLPCADEGWNDGMNGGGVVEFVDGRTAAKRLFCVP